MSACGFAVTPDIELYFYGELDPVDRARVEAHLRHCATCRQRLDDLQAIRRALASRPMVDAPPAGDWSGFMRRLDAACSIDRRAPLAASPRARGRSLRPLLTLAAMLALVTMGVLLAARFRGEPPATRTAVNTPAVGSVQAPPIATQERSLREVSAQHLERSKLVVLGLATLDPKAKAADWQYERQLAGSLLSDTRLYRMAAQDRGMNDVARVMRDLETVLIEASMSDSTDRDALERVQRLIARRDLMMKMQVVAINSAGS
jgi:hypothetical protein